MSHASLNLQPEDAADLMEAVEEQLHRDDAYREPLPPGAELDAAVAKALGVEPAGWRPTSSGSVAGPWNSMASKGLMIDERAVEYLHQPYSRDPAYSDEARRLAFKKGLGHIVVLRTTRCFMACRQGDPNDLMDEIDAVTSDGDSVSFFTDSELMPGMSPAHAVALAIVGSEG